MFTEDDLLPISALQHLMFCERQCALIHVERLWAENRLTVEGKHLHDRVHDQGDESRGDVRIARGVALRSLRLGLTGKADVIEFHRSADSPSAPQSAIALHDVEGWWRPFPIEYKRGKPKAEPCDAVQLCAQALCLEEMLHVRVESGALFYGRTRRRLDVRFDDALRGETEGAARRLHDLIESSRTPPPRPRPQCDRCSLEKLCLPRAAGRSVASYLQRAIEAAAAQETRP